MKEDKNESRWDKLLNIRTMGRDDTHADQYRYPYEPTPYSSCHIRQDVSLSESNMMSESMRKQQRIKKMRYRPEEWR